MVNSIPKHVEAIQTEGKLSSSFKIVEIMKETVCYNTLVYVTVNGFEYSMKEVNVSVVYLVMGKTSKYRNPTYKKKIVFYLATYFYY
jgi:hypothetical protein